VAVKISSLPTYVSEGLPFRSLQPQIRRVVAAFGAERRMRGSDRSRMPCPYSDWVLIPECCDFLSEHEKSLIMGGTLANWLDWPEAELSEPAV
jgi:L-fuconolactonase